MCLNSAYVLLTKIITCGESRTFSATSFAVSSEFTLGDNKFIPLICLFSLLMNSQLTRRADMKNPTVQSHLEQDKEIRLFNLALCWPHSSLRVSI